MIDWRSKIRSIDLKSHPVTPSGGWIVIAFYAFALLEMVRHIIPIILGTVEGDVAALHFRVVTWTIIAIIWCYRTPDQKETNR